VSHVRNDLRFEYRDAIFLCAALEKQFGQCRVLEGNAIFAFTNTARSSGLSMPFAAVSPNSVAKTAHGVGQH